MRTFAFVSALAAAALNSSINALSLNSYNFEAIDDDVYTMFAEIETNKIDQDAFEAQNKLRTKPKSFLPLLEEMAKNFDGKILQREGQANLRTQEGKPAVDEAINYLKKAKPVGALQWNDFIALACKDHVEDQGPDGLRGHDGTDGSGPRDRMKRHASIGGKSGENIAFGTETGVDVIMGLFIDDGVPSRGHRHNLFEGGFTQTGIYSGDHKDYGIMTCLDYAGAVAPLGQKPGKAPGEAEKEAKMQAFMKEPVHFDKPKGANGSSTSISVQLKGNEATKFVTKTWKFPNGKTKVETKTIKKTL